MSDYQAACKVEFQPFNRSYSQLTFMKNNILVPTVYFVSPNPENKYLNPTQPSLSNDYLTPKYTSKYATRSFSQIMYQRIPELPYYQIYNVHILVGR